MKDNVGQRAPAHRSPRQDPCFDPLIRSPVSRDSRAAASGSFLDWKGLPEAAEGGTGVDLGVRVEGVGLPVAGGGGVGVAGQLGEAALLYRETHGDH